MKNHYYKCVAILLLLAIAYPLYIKKLTPSIQYNSNYKLYSTEQQHIILHNSLKHHKDEILKDHDSFFASKIDSIYKDQQCHNFVAKISLPSPHSKESFFFYKKFQPTKIRGILSSRSRAQKAWDAYLIYEKKSINTPRPLAIIENNDNPKKFPSYVLFESFENNFSFASHIEEINKANSLSPEHITLIRKVAKFTATIHNKGVFHRDYSGNNILIRTHPTNEYEITIVDINRSRFQEKLNLTKRTQDIVRLGLDSKSLSYFLEEYAKNTIYDYSLLEKKFKSIKKLHDIKNQTKKYLKSFLRKKEIVANSVFLFLFDPSSTAPRAR